MVDMVIQCVFSTDASADELQGALTCFLPNQIPLEVIILRRTLKEAKADD
jgi:hypothetical protein